MRCVCLALLLSLLTLPLPATQSQTATGTWTGTALLAPIPVILHIVKEDGVYQATADCPAQKAFGLACSFYSDGRTVTITIPTPVPLSFAGKMSGRTIDVVWAQGAFAGTMSLARLGYGRGITGDWKGTAETAGTGLALHVPADLSSQQATVDLTTQNVSGIPATVSLIGSTITFSYFNVDPTKIFSFAGTIVGNAATGSWTQSGQSGSMTLARQSP